MISATDLKNKVIDTVYLTKFVNCNELYFCNNCERQDLTYEHFVVKNNVIRLECPSCGESYCNIKSDLELDNTVQDVYLALQRLDFLYDVEQELQYLNSPSVYDMESYLHDNRCFVNPYNNEPRSLMAYNTVLDYTNLFNALSNSMWSLNFWNRFVEYLKGVEYLSPIAVLLRINVELFISSKAVVNNG